MYNYNISNSYNKHFYYYVIISLMELIIWLHNIRSIHNVGSIMRTAEGFGVKKVIFSGYTPYPKVKNDKRLPHIIEKLELTLHKTALGAEKILEVEYFEDINKVFKSHPDFQLLALEQSKDSVNLKDYKLDKNSILLLGEEVNGITEELLKKADKTLEITMYGQKESFNVSVAAGICLYQLLG